MRKEEYKEIAKRIAKNKGMKLVIWDEATREEQKLAIENPEEYFIFKNISLRGIECFSAILHADSKKDVKEEDIKWQWRKPK